MGRLELVSGGLGRDVRRPTVRDSTALPNAERLGVPTDDPEARRGEMLVVLALCRARAAGARERALADRVLTLVR